MPRRASAFSFMLLLTAPAGTQAADWPGWRGPTGQGQTTEKNLPLTWGGKAKHQRPLEEPAAGNGGEGEPGPEPVEPDRLARPRIRHRELLAGPEARPQGHPRASRRLLPGN